MLCSYFLEDTMAKNLEGQNTVLLLQWVNPSYFWKTVKVWNEDDIKN